MLRPFVRCAHGVAWPFGAAAADVQSNETLEQTRAIVVVVVASQTSLHLHTCTIMLMLYTLLLVISKTFLLKKSTSGRTRTAGQL